MYEKECLKTPRIVSRDDFIQADLRKKPDSKRIVLTYLVGQKLIAKRRVKGEQI